MSDSQDWIQIFKTYGLPEAQIVAGQLTAEGIPAKAMPLEAGGRMGISVGKLGEAAVFVPGEFVEQAEEIIYEPLPEGWEDEIEESDDLDL